MDAVDCYMCSYSMHHLLCEANVFRGIHAPHGLHEQHREVAVETVGHVVQLLSLSNMDNRDTEDVENLQAIIERFLKLFNGRWENNKPEHFCCLDGSRVPCHPSVAAAKLDMADSVCELVVAVAWGRM